MIGTGAIELGSVRCGTSTLTPISIANFGEEPISFSAASTLDFVSVSPTTGVVEPGGRLELVLTANASGASLSVGFVEGAVLITTSAELMPRIISATITGAIVQTGVQALDFGIASLAAPPDPRMISVRNEGNAEIEVSANVPAAPFSIVGSPLTLGPDAEGFIEVGFSPQFTGEYATDLGLEFSGPLCQEPPTAVALSGEISDAGLLVNSTVVDFGTSTCGVGSSTQTLRFSSNMADLQTLSFDVAGSASAAYTLVNAVALPAGGSVSVDVTRKAIGNATPGSRTAVVSVAASPAGESFDVQLQHEIEAPLLSYSADSLSFNMNEGTEMSQNITVANLGNVPATVSVKPSRVSLSKNATLRVEPSSFTLSPNQTQVVSFNVDAGKGTFENLTKVDITASGQCNDGGTIGVSVTVKK